MLVVKAGGAHGIAMEAIADDIARLSRNGQEVVIVHGGSAAANRLGERLGRPPVFLESESGVRSRYTDMEALEILAMALSGLVKPDILIQLHRRGVAAIGLTGVDGALIQARRKAALRVKDEGAIRIVRDDRSGRITHVNTDLLTVLISAGYVPVISPPAIDPTEGMVNVDADRLAASVAAAMKAEDLVILSNVPGLLREQDRPASLIANLSYETLEQSMGFAVGRMKLKIIAAREALSGGVGRVILGDGRCPNPVLSALNGRGTVISRNSAHTKGTAQHGH